MTSTDCRFARSCPRFGQTDRRSCGPPRGRRRYNSWHGERCRQCCLGTSTTHACGGFNSVPLVSSCRSDFLRDPIQVTIGSLEIKASHHIVQQIEFCEEHEKVCLLPWTLPHDNVSPLMQHRITTLFPVPTTLRRHARFRWGAACGYSSESLARDRESSSSRRRRRAQTT